MSISALLRDLDAIGYHGHRALEAAHKPTPPLPGHARDAIRAALDRECPGWTDDVLCGRGRAVLSGVERTRRWRERKQKGRAA